MSWTGERWLSDHLHGTLFEVGRNDTLKSCSSNLCVRTDGDCNEFDKYEGGSGSFGYVVAWFSLRLPSPSPSGRSDRQH